MLVIAVAVAVGAAVADGGAAAAGALLTTLSSFCSTLSVFIPPGPFLPSAPGAVLLPIGRGLAHTEPKRFSTLPRRMRVPPLPRTYATLAPSPPAPSALAASCAEPRRERARDSCTGVFCTALMACAGHESQRGP